MFGHIVILLKPIFRPVIRAKNGTFSKPSDDIQMSGDKRNAKFIIGRTLRDGPYNLTYTGVNSRSGTKVTIAAEQSQTMPNDPTHIGMDGDCASATATDEKNNGKYIKAVFAEFD